MSTQVTIVPFDFDNQQHEADLMRVMDAYAREPLIRNKPLPDDVLQRLLPGLKAHGGAVILLAYAGEQVAGMAISLLGFSTFAGRPLLNIHDFAIHPDAQGQGVGRQLMDAVVAEATRCDCCKVTLEVSANNHAARRLYLKCGFDPGEPETTEQGFWVKTLE